MPTRHVAIVAPRYAEALRAGRKRIESRFSTTRRAPFGRIRHRDTIYFKLAGGPFIGHCRVRRVVYRDDLTPAAIDAIRRRHNHAILAPAAYWRARRRCRFGVLIWLGRFQPGTAGPTIPRQFGSGWVVLPS